MALLIDTGISGWMTDDDLRDEVLNLLPGADVRVRADIGDPADIRMVAVSRLAGDLPGLLPKLELVQKLGAGVETILAHPALPTHVRVARLKPDAPAREIAEYFLTYILQEQRQVRFFAAEQAQARWSPVEPREAPKTVVGVLGLGHIGGRTALMLRDVGFRVIGWSRSPKALDGIDCRAGAQDLAKMLGECDYVCAILPSTAQTRGMMETRMLRAMKPGAVLLNAGRGDLIDADALVSALDGGQLAGAVLDVLETEPLPADSPLWRHPKVTITPHVSGWHLGDAVRDVAENYRRLTTGEPLLHEVDRGRGY
jgi:glyoxylate/hydroxypyruvate reductase A